MTCNNAAFTHVFNQQQHQRVVFHGQRHAPQTFTARAGLILMLFMVGRQRAQHFALPARRHRRVQQAVPGLNKTWLLRQKTQSFAAELARPGERRQIHRATLKVDI
ncbi:Uncharacterised protein [Klebsiella pneumoniae]|nr:Uncharacterised protein [Klebsiella pneumoniae]